MSIDKLADKIHENYKILDKFYQHKNESGWSISAIS